ncbi:MAG: PAS domain S-box protein [Desulfobacteraceae bacterium]|nr:PAS domain S-box protein [Desulfobacteraceae bacterium]
MDKILIIMDHRENRQLLQKRLEKHYTVFVVQGPVKNGDAVLKDDDYDLAVFDGPALDQHMGRIIEVKKGADPVFLPVLMVTTKKEVGYITRHLWHAVDELILSPIDSVELSARIEILLRARRYSLSLHRRLERMFECAPAGLFRAAPDGTIQDVNPAMVKIAGAAGKNDLLGTRLTDLFDSESRIEMSELLTGNGHPRDLRVRRADGSRFWALVQAAAIHDENSDISYIEGAVEDIEDRVEAEKDSRVKSYLLDHANDAIIVHDTKGRISYVNEAVCRNLGYTRSEMYNMALSKLATPENASKIGKRFELLFEHGEAVFESAHLKKDGGILPVEVHALIVDIDGEMQVLSIARDITERKNYETRLEGINRSLRLLSEANRALMKADDPQELLDQICSIIVETGGYRAAWVARSEDTAGKPVVPIAHVGFAPDYLEQLGITWADTELGRGPMGKAIRTGKTSILQDVSADPDFSLWRERALAEGRRAITAIPIKIERRIWGALAIYADHKNAFQQAEIDILEEMARDLAYGMAALQDRIEREKAEAELEKSEQQYRNVTDDMPALVCRFKPDGEFTFVNRGLCLFFDSSKEQILGTNMYGYLVAEHREPVRQLLAGLTPENAVASYTVDFTFPDGNPGLHEWIARAIFDDNREITEYQAVGIDITERKQMKAEKDRLEEQVRQSQKMEALGTLAGGIAHDFNNILSAVIGYAELSLGDLDPETQLGKNIQQVVKGGYRARDLVTQILTFTRQSEQEPQPVQVKLIVKEAAKLLRASLPATIEINEEIESASLVEADPVQIHQIVMNLCTNAGHAMADTGGRMSMRLNETDFEAERSMGVYRLLPGRYICLTVEDTGPGIPDKIVDRVFEPYFTTKEKEEGTGLGLSVVHGIVEHLGGGIDLRTQEGEGTAFDVYLPVMKTAGKQQAEETENQLPQGSERVLFVDDEPSVVNMGRLMLESLGYSATACGSGTEALEKFTEAPEQFDLVITDMTMPQMTGLELAREIAAIRPNIPIILSTGYSSKIPANVTRTTSIREVARKPLSKKNLAHLLSRVLSNSKGQEGPGG